MQHWNWHSRIQILISEGPSFCCFPATALGLLCCPKPNLPHFRSGTLSLSPS